MDLTSDPRHACLNRSLGGAPDQKVARSTEQTPPDQIEAPDQLGSEASRFNLELQPNAHLTYTKHLFTNL